MIRCDVKSYIVCVLMVLIIIGLAYIALNIAYAIEAVINRMARRLR